MSVFRTVLALGRADRLAECQLELLEAVEAGTHTAM
jgi:hypothetical protein